MKLEKFLRLLVELIINPLFKGGQKYRMKCVQAYLHISRTIEMWSLCQSLYGSHSAQNL